MTHDLDPTTARLRAVLAAHPGVECAVAPVAAGLDVPIAEVEAGLRQLETERLITPIRAGRYRLSEDLRAEHAHDPVLPKYERREAQRRMLEWYLARTGSVDRILNPLARCCSPIYDAIPPDLFADTNEALAWFKREVANIVAAQQIAVDNEQDWLVYQFAETLWTALRITYRSDELAATQRLGADAAARSGHVLEPICRARQAFAESNRGHHSIAESLATQAINRATTLDHPRGLAIALGIRARAFRKAGDLRSAQADQLRALEIDTKRGSVRGQALHCRSLGELALKPSTDEADPRRALDYFIRAANLFRAVGDEVGHARTMIGKARALAHLARYQDALRVLDDIEDVLRTYGAPGYLAALVAARAEVHTQRGDHDTAHIHYRMAAAHLTEAGPGAADALKAITTRRDDLAASR